MVSGGYVFNTEAHPVDIAALYCCSAEKHDDDLVLMDLHDNVDLLALLDLVDTPKDEYLSAKRNKQKSLFRKKVFEKPIEQQLKAHVTSTIQLQPPTQQGVPAVDIDSPDHTQCQAIEVMFFNKGLTIPHIPNDSEEDLDMDKMLEEEEASSNYHLLACPAQPFHMRWSILGEMFPDENDNS